MMKNVCTLELMSVLDMINMILLTPLRSFTRVLFYCLLSRGLKSLFLPSVHRIKTCEITGIYIGRFGSSFIFFTWTVRYKSMLQHSFQECVRMCMCLGSKHGISIIILFVRCDRNCLALFCNIHNLWLFNWFSSVYPYPVTVEFFFLYLSVPSFLPRRPTLPAHTLRLNSGTTFLINVFLSGWQRDIPIHLCDKPACLCMGMSLCQPLSHPGFHSFSAQFPSSLNKQFRRTAKVWYVFMNIWLSSGC